MSQYVPWNSQPLEAWRQRHAPGHCISLKGRQTHYMEQGEGEPIILIHGFNMDLNTWAFNIDALAQRFKVFTFDLWGLGYSSRDPMDYGYQLYAEQLALFMDALNIAKATLVGHSMGGGTAIKFALDHSNKVTKLVLVDSTGIPNPLPWRSKLFTTRGIGELLLGINSDFLRRKNLEDVWLHNGNRLTPEVFAKITQFQKVRGSSEVLLEILRREFFHTLEAEIQQLGQRDIPTLIVWGKHDASIPLQIGQRMHQAMKGSSLEVIDEGGHMPNFECPEQFNRLLLEFI